MNHAIFITNTTLKKQSLNSQNSWCFIIKHLFSLATNFFTTIDFCYLFVTNKFYIHSNSLILKCLYSIIKVRA